MAEGHDREILRRLDRQASRLAEVEGIAVSEPTEASVSYGKWRAALRGTNALMILGGLIMIAVLVVMSGILLFSYTHATDSKTERAEFVGALKQSNHEFVGAIRELTTVQREGNCLARTKGSDPEMCRSLSR